MPLSTFDDKSHPPQPDDVSKALGATAKFWREIITHVSQTHPPIAELWNFAGAKYGWSLRLKQRNRIILYLTPQQGQFLAGIVLGEKAAKAAHENGLPVEVLALIEAAPKYAEGRGIRVEVQTKKDVVAVEKLVRLKIGD